VVGSRIRQPLFLCANGGGVEELLLLIAELLFEPLIELIGTIVIRFLFGK